MRLIPYNNDYHDTWNKCLSHCRCQPFLFNREYMEYHSDRFNDCSLLFEHKGKIIALFPASVCGDVITSHGGLTYGGVLSHSSVTAELMLVIYRLLIDYYKFEFSAKEIIIKPVPHIYSSIAEEEQLYSLYVNNAVLIGRGLSQVTNLKDKYELTYLRKRCLVKALKNNIIIHKATTEEQWILYHKMLSDVLEYRHSCKPVHTIDELLLLSHKFPKNIELHLAYKDDEIVAGTILYLSKPVVHAQYIAASLKGREVGALDFLFDTLMHSDKIKDYKYFDFGISTLHDGTEFNLGLCHQKEGFGGRGICYDTYKISIY